MKREASDHPKLWDLVDALPEPYQNRFAAVGLLEGLWHFTAKFTPRGDVGSKSDAALARWLQWPLDPAELVRILADTGWIDRCDEHRLLVHEWPQHADDAIHRQLARARLFFADGSEPKWGRLTGGEREKAGEFYTAQRKNAEASPAASTAGDSGDTQGMGARDAPTGRTLGARRAPAGGEPEPCQSPARAKPRQSRVCVPPPPGDGRSTPAEPAEQSLPLPDSEPEADGLRTTPERWANMLAKEPGGRDHHVAWLEHQLPWIEAEALASFADEPSDRQFHAKVKAILWARWRNTGGQIPPARASPGRDADEAQETQRRVATAVRLVQESQRR